MAAQPLGGVDFPTSAWRAEQIVRTFADIHLPAGISPGTYELHLNLQPADTAHNTSRQPSDWPLEQIEVSGRPRNFEIPEMTTRLDTSFADQITLLGYDLEQSDEILFMTLYWQANTETETAYKVFTHLLDADGAIVAQLDLEPQAGASPTTSWVAGEVVVDALEISSPELDKVQTIIVGLYDSVSGSRLTVADTQADSVTIKRRP